MRELELPWRRPSSTKEQKRVLTRAGQLSPQLEFRAAAGTPSYGPALLELCKWEPTCQHSSVLSNSMNVDSNRFRVAGLCPESREQTEMITVAPRSPRTQSRLGEGGYICKQSQSGTWKAKAGSQETGSRDHRNAHKNECCSGYGEGMVRMLMDLYGLAGRRGEQGTQHQYRSTFVY